MEAAVASLDTVAQDHQSRVALIAFGAGVLVGSGTACLLVKTGFRNILACFAQELDDIWSELDFLRSQLEQLLFDVECLRAAQSNSRRSQEDARQHSAYDDQDCFDCCNALHDETPANGYPQPQCSNCPTRERHAPECRTCEAPNERPRTCQCEHLEPARQRLSDQNVEPARRRLSDQNVEPERRKSCDHCGEPVQRSQDDLSSLNGSQSRTPTLPHVGSDTSNDRPSLRACTSEPDSEFNDSGHATAIHSLSHIGSTATPSVDGNNNASAHPRHWYQTRDDSPLRSSRSGGQGAILAQAFRKIDLLQDGTDADKLNAYNMLKCKETKMSHNVEFVWRLAKATFDMSKLPGTSKQEQRILVYKARDYAQQALRLDNNNAGAHKWVGITVGSVGDYEGQVTRVRNGMAFKWHIERAVELNPNDPTTQHLLGRWHYGVFMLPWVQKKFVTTVFPALPHASVDDALRYFHRADDLKASISENWKENSLYIGKCYIEKKDVKSACMWLLKAKYAPTRNREDEAVNDEVECLLEQHKLC